MRRTVDLQWVRRTLARVQWLIDRVDNEQLAAVLVAHGTTNDVDDVQSIGEYLCDVAEFMKRLRPEQPRPCAVCGSEIRDNDVERPEARYCSAACRQRAYRARVTSRQPGEQRTRHDLAVRDASLDLSATGAVTLEIERQTGSVQ